MKSNLWILLFISLSLFQTSMAQAEYRNFNSPQNAAWMDVNLESPITVEPWEEYPVRVGHQGWYQVKGIRFWAYAHHDAQLDVYANGDRKGSVPIPGRDPYYELSINDTVRTIVFRNSSSMRVTIQRLKAAVILSTQLETENPCPSAGCPFQPGTYPEIDRFLEENVATSLARAAELLVSYLNPHSDPATEYVPYLLPIKLAAGHVRYIAGARGVLGKDVRPSLEALAARIVQARPFINAALKKDAMYELAVRLLALKEKISDLLD